MGQNNFFFYVKPATADNEIGRTSGCTHMASEQFGKIGVGDIVWSITCIKDRLYTFNRMVVEKLLTQEQADALYDMTDAWPASHHIYQEPPTPMTPVEITDLAHSLRFDGPVTQLPEKFNGRNFQSVRQLTPASADLVNERWQSVDKQVLEPLFDKIKSRDDVDMFTVIFTKEDPSLNFVQTNRLFSMHLRLKPGALATDSLKSIVAELQEVPRIHEINVMGQSVDDQATLMLSELKNTASIIIRDISISEATLETLRTSLPDCSVESCDSSQDDVDYYSDLASDLLERDTIDAATNEYTEQIRIGFDLETAYLLRGSIHAAVEYYEKAIADYSAAIEIDPEHALAYAYSLRAEAYFALEDYKKAVADYSAAVKIDPEYDLAYDKRGDAYYALEKYEKAIADHSAAIKINPKHDLAYFNRGAAYYNLKEYNKALDDCHEAIRQDPDFAAAYHWRGQCNKALGNDAQAETDFAKAEELGYSN